MKAAFFSYRKIDEHYFIYLNFPHMDGYLKLTLLGVDSLIDLHEYHKISIDTMGHELPLYKED